MIKKAIKNFISILNREVPIKRLIKRGMKVGKNFNKQQGCYIDPTHCFLISIGNNVTFSIRVTLLAHDASTKKILDYAKFGKIIIEDNVFIGANTTILPNVTIGKNSIIGAGSVVTKNIPENSVAVGNPARVIYTLEEYKNKMENLKNDNNTFDESYTMRGNLTKDKIEELKKVAENGIGFIY